MYRSAIEKLEKWKTSKNARPLVIYGARQVGKTWLMKEFGAKHFDSVAYFSFDSDSLLKNIFEKDFNISRIIRELSIALDKKITQDSLIIFDEVQECPLALTSLKYFNENAGEYRIIAAGSLLGVMTLEGTGFPVGKVDNLTIYPMTFYEFMETIEPRFLPIFKNPDFSGLATFHDSITELLKQYFFIGGMPAAVKKYSENRDFGEVRDVQRAILDSYYADFAKHIPSAYIARTRDIWESVPTQLARENKRFLYSEMKPGSRGRDYELALHWLVNTGLIHKLYRVNLPYMPLIGYKEAAVFKLYMNDIGLLTSRAGLEIKTYLDDNNKTFSHYKGGLAEQFVLQELMAANDKLPVYYWASGKNTAEIEFVIQYNGEIIPLEVKSGKNVKSESLNHYRKEFHPLRAVRASLKNYGFVDGLYSLPLYMTGSLADILR
ncbi:MAG: ATP-binding protein [Treponema sp.]|jgi:predicted AAA+ superfamily ATPase|nr:ATP-binding protein [Treponema sp.]